MWRSTGGCRRSRPSSLPPPGQHGTRRGLLVRGRDLRQGPLATGPISTVRSFSAARSSTCGSANAVMPVLRVRSSPALRFGPVPVEVTTDRAPVYPRVLEDSSLLHCTSSSGTRTTSCRPITADSKASCGRCEG
jgi:hypothetical protein